MKNYQIKALATGITELFIYGDIGENWYEPEQSNDAKTIVEKLAEITTPVIDVRINSYGGSVVDAIAIYNALKRHSATINVYIDGVAMSAASLIAMAGDTVNMADNALMMIHAPWNIVAGNSATLRIEADILDKYSLAMVSSYYNKTKTSNSSLALTESDIELLLKDGLDHYYTAAEALELGLIDTITQSLQIAASALQPIAARYQLPSQWLTQNTPKPINKEHPMPTPHETVKTENPPQSVEVNAAAIEQQRQQSIQAIFSHVPQARADILAMQPAMLIDTSITEADARKQVLAKLAENVAPVSKSHHIQMGMDERDTFNVLAAASLAVKAGLEKPSDKSRELMGSSLLMLAEKHLHINGVSTARMSKRDIVAAAFTHSTSDFSNLLLNVAEKSLLKGYEEAGETFQQWTTAGSVSDFKAVSRVDLNSFPSLDNVSEGAEYTYGTIGDRGETVQIATYGKLFSITREAIINDDLNAFTRIPQKMGRAAIRTIGDLVYAVLTSNPTMSDSVALFHATHNNLLTGAAISTESVDAMAVAMALQTDAGANAKGLNIPLAYLIVPMALRGLANTVRTSQYRVGNADTKMANTAPNIVANTFEVIADARLDAASSTSWYGAANPAQFDTIEVSYLDGMQTPYIEQQQGFTTDGAVFKVRIDAGVKALDFRTLAKNPN